MKTLPAAIAALAALIAACGGSERPPASAKNAESHAEPGKGAHGEHPEGAHQGGEHHAGLPPAVREFHDVLAPLWHADKGPDRVTKTCEKGATLHEKATATNDAALAAATRALVAECEKEGRPDFDAKLHAVHERFHQLAEKRGGGEHDAKK